MLKIILTLLLTSNLLLASDLSILKQNDILFLGAFLMMIVYNFIYYFINRSNIYFEYFMYHILVLFLVLVDFGYLGENSFKFSLNGVPISFFFMASLTLISFTRNYLNLKTKEPKLDNFFFKTQYISLAFFGISLLEIENIYIKSLGALYVVLLSLSIVLASFYLGFIKKDFYSKLYLIGFMGVLFSVVYALLSYFNILDISSDLAYVFESSILFESCVFSYALTYKSKELAIKLKQNELLFKELSHRVKNNLQAIISILTLQKLRTKDKEQKNYVDSTIKRIRSISLIHEQLQSTKEVGEVNIYEYLYSLSKEYEKFLQNLDISVECKKDIYLDIEKVTSIGLIINELLSNSIKHAFKDIDKPSIKLKFTKDKNYNFIYEDNGLGFSSTKENLGSLLIKTLGKSHLKAKIEVDTNGRYFFSMSFN